MIKTHKNKGTIKTKEIQKYQTYTPLDFAKVEQLAKKFADHIQKNFDAIADVLLEYESFEVAKDEAYRTLDLLTNLKENNKYFKLRIGSVATFLPRNQPLYAFTCFAVIPSLMAKEVHFRIPKSMQIFLPKLLNLLDFKKFFPNIHVTEEGHQSFLRSHSALRVDPKSKQTIPATDVVIFTGTPTRADQLRSVFDSRTLFISNGAGHNPVIVAKDANLEAAADAVLCLQLYNQGQDCAAPNAILVHKQIFEEFYRLILKGLSAYKVGHYKDKKCKIGPISDPFDLIRIQEFLMKNKEFIDPKAPGIIRSHEAIVEPTVICKPLKWGGNFTEMFAPIIFLQEYDTDSNLALYFENTAYQKNAMYVTVYGTSDYAKHLVGKMSNGKLLHDASTLLSNTHLHVPGIERGTQPYGGYGYGASNLWINGSGISKPTLPQRDIYEQVAASILKKKDLSLFRKKISKYTEIEEKNIEKLLRIGNLAAQREEPDEDSSHYLDLSTLTPTERNQRYLKIDLAKTHRLLQIPNVQYLSDLTPESIKHMRKLQSLLQKKPASQEEFKTMLYSIVGELGATANRQDLQKVFFGHVYQLLFAKKFGPKLTTFLWEADANVICELLDI